MKKLPWRRMVGGLAAAIYLYLALPGECHFPGRGLEPSWVYAINFAHTSHLSYGRDVIFTFGPLGWMLVPAPVGDNLLWGFIFNLVMHGLLALVLALYVLGGAAVRLTVFAIVWLLAVGMGFPREYQWLVSLLCLLGATYTFPEYARALTLAATFLSVLFIHVKFSLGIAAVGTLILFHMLNCLHRQPDCRRLLLISLLTGLCAGVFLAIMLFPGLSDFLVWLRGSWELSQGYAIAMSLPGDKTELMLGLLLLGGYIAGVWWGLRSKPRRDIFLVFSSFAVFVVFKHSFVRQDGHVAMFFTTLPVVFAAWLLCSHRKMLPIAAVLLTMALPLGFLISSKYGYFNGRVLCDLVRGKSARLRVEYLKRHKEFELNLRKQAQIRLTTSRLETTPLLEKMRAAKNGVDVVPWELSCLPANGLPWRVQPLLQFYSVYTPWLDRYVADFYANPAAPEYILLHYAAIDGRCMLWDAPLAWQKIFERYVPCGEWPLAQFLALRRLPSPRNSSWEEIGTAVLSDENWLALPAVDSWLFLEMDLPLSGIGRILAAIFRVPPVALELEYDGGERFTYRFVPAVAAHGLLVNPVPTRYRQLARLLQGGECPRVRRLRFIGPGRNFYPKDVMAHWRVFHAGIPAP